MSTLSTLTLNLRELAQQEQISGKASKSTKSGIIRRQVETHNDYFNDTFGNVFTGGMKIIWAGSVRGAN